MQQHIPVVQGYAVDNGDGKSNNTPSWSHQEAQGHNIQGENVEPQSMHQHYQQEVNFNGVQGENQPRQFQDVVWAIAFVIHLLIMVVIMMTMGSSYNNNGYDYSGVLRLVSICSLVGISLSSLVLGLMMKFATEMVRIALLFSVGCSLIVGVLGALTGQVWMSVLGFLSFAIGLCYVYFVWGRIPFAAANLRTGLAAVKANMGTIAIAYLFMALAFGWTIWWSVTAGTTMHSAGQATLFFFILSYYWVHQVFQNTVHVTTAGVVGTWWFVPSEASSCWSSAIQNSFVRATTLSFGSICFGSFLVALVQTLRAMHRIAHENDDCNFLVCIIDCILGCVEEIIEYFNKWAYVYVGLYGYNYLDAGRNVITLFQNKGWSTIITDDLVDNVLFMVSLSIGLLTGLVGLFIGMAERNLFSSIGLDDSRIAGFLLGFLVGNLFATIVMSVVASAVNTVIVLFAEAPAEFQTNHPQLSDDMRMTWRQICPESGYF